MFFNWGSEQHTALTKVKKVLSSAPMLHYFDPKVVSTVQADASQSGLATCLLQKGKPIAYASRSLSPSECNYAQIEKELLAVVFVCSKFHQYIYGFHTKVQSDLESIMLYTKHHLDYKECPSSYRNMIWKCTIRIHERQESFCSRYCLVPT